MITNNITTEEKEMSTNAVVNTEKEDIYLAVWKVLMDHIDEHQRVDTAEMTAALADVIGDELAIFYQPTNEELADFLATIKKRIESKIAYQRWHGGYCDEQEVDRIHRKHEGCNSPDDDDDDAACDGLRA